MAKPGKRKKAEGWLVKGLDGWAKILERCGAGIPAQIVRDSTELLIEPAVFGSVERQQYGGTFLTRLFSIYGSALYDVLRATGPSDDLENLAIFEVNSKSGNTSNVVRVAYEGSVGKLRNKDGRPWLRSGKDGEVQKNTVIVNVDENRRFYEVSLVGLRGLAPGVYAGVAENKEKEILFHILVSKNS